MGRVTHARKPHDLDPEAADGGPSAPRRAVVVLLLFAAIAVGIAVDLVADQLEGASSGHVIAELAVMAAALAGAGLLVRDLLRTRARARGLARDLESTRMDAARYREEAAELLAGLGEAIDRQLDRWRLTAAEKEVALLLLKGLSHKEVATVRGTTERTARKQARKVYDKAQLDGRAALSAFFLEDLLPALRGPPGAP